MNQSHFEFNKTGLTFSISDVNFEGNSLDLVPILFRSPEKEKFTSICDLNLKNSVSNEINVLNNLNHDAIHSKVRMEELNKSYLFNPEELETNNEIHKENVLRESFSNVYSETLESNSQIISPSHIRDNNLDKISTTYEKVSNYWFYCAVINGLAEWKPFSIKDSNRIEMKYCEINSIESKYTVIDDCVATDGGRYDVFITKRQKVSVYWDEAPMEIRRASWFYRPEDESFYLPYTENECEKLEDRFKVVLENNLWHQPFELNGCDKERCLEDKFVFHSPNTMVEYRRYGYLTESDNVLKGRVVYRGIDGFRNHLEPGESDNIDHVIFVIHGIGSVCDMAGRCVVECVKTMKHISSQMLKSHFPQHNGRIELLPVSWHNKFHSETSSVDNDLSKITLKSVPKLRNFTNNTLVDVLCYSSPTYCQTILTIVSAEMNRLRHLFVSRNPDYDGSISITGHSLGSMIAFDLISLQGNNFDNHLVPISDIDAIPRLEFEIGHLFALGSPISLLLTARGHSFLGEEFHLSHCKGFFNIFHPFDPVAYRLEPMLVPHCDTRPVIIPHHKGRKRLHLELKDNFVRVSQDIKTRLFQTLKSTWSSLQEFATAHTGNIGDELGEENEMMRVLNKIDNSIGERDDVESCVADAQVITSQLNGGRRVDYVLQEAPLESFNDYLFALGSHACYWDSEDTILLMLKEIYSTLNISPETRLMESSFVKTTKLHYQTRSTATQLPPIIPSVSPHQTISNIGLPPIFPGVQNKQFFVPNFTSDDSSSDNLHMTSENKFESNVINEQKSLLPNNSTFYPSSYLMSETVNVIGENISDQFKNMAINDLMEMQSEYDHIEKTSNEPAFSPVIFESSVSNTQDSVNRFQQLDSVNIDNKLLNSHQTSKSMLSTTLLEEYGSDNLSGISYNDIPLSSESVSEKQNVIEKSSNNITPTINSSTYPLPPKLPHELVNACSSSDVNGYTSSINNYPVFQNNTIQKQTTGSKLINLPPFIPVVSKNTFYPSLSSDNVDYCSSFDTSEAICQNKMETLATFQLESLQKPAISTQSDFSTNSQISCSTNYSQSPPPLLEQFESIMNLNSRFPDSSTPYESQRVLWKSFDQSQPPIFSKNVDFLPRVSDCSQSLSFSSDIFGTELSNNTLTKDGIDFLPVKTSQNELANQNQSLNNYFPSKSDHYFDSLNFDESPTSMSSSQSYSIDASTKSKAPTDTEQKSGNEFNMNANVSNFVPLYKPTFTNASSLASDLSRYPSLPSEADKPKQKSNQDLSFEYSKTPSPKVSNQNIRNSPKTSPAPSSSVFNSKPLIPQSGKLFKKK